MDLNQALVSRKVEECERDKPYEKKQVEPKVEERKGGRTEPS